MWKTVDVYKYYCCLTNQCPCDIFYIMDKRLIGRKKSPEEIEKISKAQRGKPKPLTTGNGNGMWKGKNAGYHAIHCWVNRHFKKPDKCETCGKPETNKRFCWANKDHKYTRERKDWFYGCYSCHAKYDFKYLGKRPIRNPNNSIKQRQCSICRKILPLTIKYFHRSNGHSFGFKYICKKCRSKQAHLNWLKCS